ncbi:aldo/keto reductase [Staphylococcus aureus]
MKYQTTRRHFIGTKVGNRLEKTAVQHGIRVKSYIKEAVKGSLKRLGIDHIDLYQLHGGTIDDPLDETINHID